ncbi:MAG TPA: MFS transporter, partial [Candidatus Dormibacteraeota bacterium]|nr:MFS transporter [Candidatus Dormibacteraeota bacterium]
MTRTVSFWTVTATLGLFLFAAAAPSPLYAVYAARWHFSAITLTEVFGVYALALLVALLFTGSLSDYVGRRPVILGAVAVQLVAVLMFVAASDVAWLFVARITQGIATGVASSVLAAALVDLQPTDHPPLAPLVNAVTPVLGLAAGALASAVVVQYAPDPLHLVYWMILAGLLAIGGATFLMPEPGAKKAGISLAPHVGVEAPIRPQFLASLPSLIAGWAVGGFYLSLGPSLALQLAGSTNRLLGGSTITVLGGVGSIAIVALRAWLPRRTMVVGGVAMTAGLLLAVLAVATTSAGLFFVSTAVTGVGFGIGWLGVLRS